MVEFGIYTALGIILLILLILIILFLRKVKKDAENYDGKIHKNKDVDNLKNLFNYNG